MREHQLYVHNLPRHVGENELAESVVIVIDLLRASSTICHALAAGAVEVVPFLEIEEALAAAKTAGREGVVLGGERKGGRIPGFDVGNSPSEYSGERAHGKRVLFTTTNGTRALHHARLAKRVVVGAFVNLSAVAESVMNAPRVDVLCAGTGGQETREDVLAAGAIASRLVERWNGRCDINDEAKAACAEWSTVAARAASQNKRLEEQVAVELRNTQGGRNLLEIGLDRDLVDCAQIDCLRVVPELHVREWRITAG